LNDAESFTIVEPSSAPIPSHEEKHVAPVNLEFESVRSATVVGIDIGSGCAKAAVLEGNARSKSIVVRESALLPIEDPAQPFATTLRLLLAKLQTRSRDCALATWPPSAQVRFIESNGAYAGRVRRELTAPEATDFTVTDTPETTTEADHVFDASPIPGSKSPGSAAKMLECGILRVDLDLIHHAFKEVRRTLRLVQLAPVSLFNAFAISQPEIATRESYFLVDIGKRRTTLIAGAQGAMRLIRVVDLGWDYVAEPLELEFGTECRGQLQSLPVDDMDVRSATADAMQRLSLEIERSLDHLHRDEHYARPIRYYISGPLTPESLPIQTLSTHLAIPAMTWNPLRRAAAGKRALAEYHLLEELPRLPAAAGAALQYLV
jgi:hypothetical protein